MSLFRTSHVTASGRLTAAVLTAALGCWSSSQALAVPLAFVQDSGTNTVYVINIDEQRVADTVPVGSFPQAVALDVDGDRAFSVGVGGIYSMNALDTAAESPFAFPTAPSRGQGAYFDTSSGLLFTSHAFETGIIGWNPAEGTEAKRYATGNGSGGIDGTSDGRRLFVANSNDGTLSIIDTDGGTTRNVFVGGIPSQPELSPYDGKVYVSIPGAGPSAHGNNRIAVVDPDTEDVSYLEVRSGPHHLEFHPTENKLFISGDTGTYWVDPTEGPSPTAHVIDSGESNTALDFNADGTELYYVRGQSNRFVAYDLDSNSEIFNVAVGSRAVAFGDFVGDFANAPPKVLDSFHLALFSEAAYSPGVTSPLSSYDRLFGFSESFGFEGDASAAVFGSADQSQVVLAFKGSDADDLVDWLGANPSFIDPSGSPTPIYESYMEFGVEALRATASFLSTSAYSNAQIVLTGHSLGGAMAQLLGNASGLTAYSFNAPGGKQLVNDESLADILSQAPQINDPFRVSVNERIYGDLVSTVGEQFDLVFTRESPYPESLVNSFPATYAKPNHIMETVIGQIAGGSPFTSDFGPIAQPNNVIWVAKAVRDLALGSDAILAIDPGGVDAYHFGVDAGSPLVKSVVFPFLVFSDVVFDLQVLEAGIWSSVGYFDEASMFDFGLDGVGEFQFFVLNAETFEPQLGIEDFTLSVSFVSGGILSAELTSFSTVSEPSTLPLFGFCMIALWVTVRRGFGRVKARVRSPGQHSACTS